MYTGLAFLAVIIGSIIFHVWTPWWWTDIASNWSAMDDTIILSFWIGGGVFILVCLFMVYCIFRYRYKEGRRSEYKPEDKKLEKGFCITVEPGIYFIPELFYQWKKENKHSNFINYDKFEKYLDFGGIRIEDNILITDNQSENLSDFIIKEVDDIESIMN